MKANDLDRKLISKKIKPTAIRQLVLQVLIKQKTAISLPELEQKFQKADRATLYRTLKTFQDHQLIHSIEGGSGSLKYALCEDSCTCEPEHLHVHFLCNMCDKTYCFNNIPIPKTLLPKGFQFSSASFVVSGICSNCTQ